VCVPTHIISIVYSETEVRILNSVNSYLHDVLVFTATLDLITRFLILCILIVCNSL